MKARDYSVCQLYCCCVPIPIYDIFRTSAEFIYSRGTGPISGVSRFGPTEAGRFGPLSKVGSFGPISGVSRLVQGRFAPNPFPPLDVSPPGRFAPGRFAPGRFAPKFQGGEGGGTYVEIHVHEEWDYTLLWQH